MKWDEFIGQCSQTNFDGQTRTDIECPKCGRHIYLDETIMLTSYPRKYKYWCSCGWSDCTSWKWRASTELEDDFYRWKAERREDD